MCEFPSVDNYTVTDFSVITLENASVGAHNIYKGLAIGGTLSDSTPQESANVCSHFGSNESMPSGKPCHSWVEHLDASGNWHWHGSGLTEGSSVDWANMAALALGAESFVDENGFSVQVVNQDDESRNNPSPVSETMASGAVPVTAGNCCGVLLGLLLATTLLTDLSHGL